MRLASPTPARASTAGKRLTTALLVALGAATPALVACADQPPLVHGTAWQITDLYLEPGTPSALPDTIAGRATLIFGETSVVGSTGCAPIQGAVTFTREGQASSVENADAVIFEEVEFEVADQQCVGQAAFIHDQLHSLLSGGFDLERVSDHEMVLTQQAEEIDSPAIRLSTERAPEVEAE